MNEKELERALTWKYFWKRKRQEIWDWVKNFFPVWIGIGMICFVIFICRLPGYWINVVLILLCATVFITIFAGCCVAILGIIYLLVKWIQFNWKLATQDAKREMKRMRKK